MNLKKSVATLVSVQTEMLRSVLAVVWIVIFLSVNTALAQTTSLSKDKYSLFQPTPQDLMREFNPDRPGVTNTPYTVDAGHFLLEFEWVNFSDTKADGVETELLNFPALTIRAGLTDESEIRIAWTSQTCQWTAANNGAKNRVSGMGDLTLFYKYNLLGNEGGPFGVALLPGIKIPTNTNGIGNQKLEQTFMLPFGIELPHDWSINFMPEIDIRKNESNDALHAEINSSINLGHQLFNALAGYLEFVSHSSDEPGSRMNLFIGAGITLKVAKNMQFDIENNFGLNSVIPSKNFIAGWAIRF